LVSAGAAGASVAAGPQAESTNPVRTVTANKMENLEFITLSPFGWIRFFWRAMLWLLFIHLLEEKPKKIAPKYTIGFTSSELGGLL
jgi:hypothetical protein